MPNKDGTNHSTANILDGLKEEELPDASLSPDSPVRKKRDMQRFNAMLFAAFIEAARIKIIIYAHWKSQIEKTLQKLRSKMKSRHDKLKNLRSAIIQQSQLSAKQLAQIFSINKSFLKLLVKIDNKITILNRKIAQQNMQINVLQQKRTELQASLAQAWQNQISALSVPDINIASNLSPQYQHYDKRSEQEKYINLKGDELKQILLEIGNNIQNKTFSILRLPNLIQENILNYLRKKLEVEWSFLPEGERESAINLKLKEPDIKKLLTYSLLELVSQDSILSDIIREYFAVDQEIAYKIAKRDAITACRDILIETKTLLEEKNKKFNSQFEQINTQSVETQSQNEDQANNIDEQLQEYESDLDNVETSLNDIDEKLYQNLSEFDNLLDAITEFNDAEKGAYLQDFIQSIEDPEEEIKHEGENSPNLRQFRT